MRTSIAVQGLFLGGDGSPSSGTFSATPNSTVTNGETEYPATPVVGELNPAGQIVAQSQEAFVIDATDDEGTEPEGSSYTFILELDGTSLREFSAAVPAASTAAESNGSTVKDSPVVTLSDLVGAHSMVGQMITGTNIPEDTTVLSVNYVAGPIGATNELTLSNPASATASGCAFVVGGAVDFAALAANAL